MFTKLLHHDPVNIWTYNLMAITFDKYGLTEIGTQAIQRGLTLIEQYGDENKLQDQLESCLDRMKNSPLKGRESTLSSGILANLQEALMLEFDAGTPGSIDDLCHTLIPDLSKIPVKQPSTPDDYPLPDREEILAEFQRLQKPSPRRKTKRGRRGRKKKSS